MFKIGTKVKITKCSNRDAIGFIGNLANKEIYAKITNPFYYHEIMKEIDETQIMIIGDDKSFISNKNGFVEFELYVP